MAAIESICLIHAGFLAPALEQAGLRVLSLAPAPGLLALGPELARREFAPDAIFQVETLGPRTLISDLGAIAARKAFLSQDTHLNAFWHIRYGALFDLVLTTQPGWKKVLAEGGLGGLTWVETLGWVGRPAPCAPFSKRETAVGFVGRFDERRPARQWMADFLGPRFHAVFRSDLPPAEVGPFYANTRIVPNEAIMGEINMRLFEAASAGCLVLNQDAGEALAEFFEPGKEVLIYRDVLELADLLRHYEAKTTEAEAIGLAARARVEREHLPVHRAGRLLSLLADCPDRAATGQAARTALALAIFDLWQADRITVNPDWLEKELAACGADPEAGAALMGLWAAMGRDARLLAHLSLELAAKIPNKDFRHCLAASAAALKLKRLDLAKLYYYRHMQQNKRPAGKPDTAADLHLLWSREAMRHGLLARPGLVFDPTRLLPACAAECLVCALKENENNLEAARKLEEILSRTGGMDPTRIALLSHVTMQAPGDWKSIVRLGMANLRNFRLEEGLEELIMAREAAAKIGQEALFARSLKWLDASGQVQRALEGNPVCN